jgi:hypothetical protein
MTSASGGSCEEPRNPPDGGPQKFALHPRDYNGKAPVHGVPLEIGGGSSPWFLETGRERVPQGNTDPGRYWRTEFLVISNNVKMGFRTDKEMTMKVVTETATKMTHEVIAADEVSASKSAAGGETLVETNAFPTDASHEFGSCVPPDLGGVNPVNVVKKWTLGLDRRVEVPAASPGKFAAHSKVASQKEIGADDRVCATP